MAAIKGFILYLTASNTRFAVNHDPEKGPREFTREDTFDDVDAGIDDEDDGHDPQRFPRTVTSGTGFTSFSTLQNENVSPSKPTIWFRKVRDFIFPPKEDMESFIPNYRMAPIFSGVIIPFSILLELPGLVDHWYIRTENNMTVEYRPNPFILNLGLGISMACALIANICLIVRFLEKRIKTTTIICVVLLTIHDVINIAAVTIFGVEHRFDDGFTYGESFWMTVCSTIASSFTNAVLIRDLYITPDFNRSGSGLTRKQRSLMIIMIILFCYICLGALVNSLMQHLSFINGLYFTVVSIETIGLGDIVPTTTATRVVVLVYSVVGILTLGVAIGMCRETIVEGMEVGYRRRIKSVRERRKEGRRRRRVENRWRRGVEWRLRQMRVPVWVQDDLCGGVRTIGRRRSGPREAPGRAGFLEVVTEWMGLKSGKVPGHSRIMHGPPGMRLNLEALSRAQLEASALEAGVPLATLIPSGFVAADDVPVTSTDSGSSSGWAQHPLAQHIENAFRPTEARTMTHARIGAISLILTRFAFAATHNHTPPPPPAPRGNGGVAFTRHESIFAGETIEASDNAYAARFGLGDDVASSWDHDYDFRSVAHMEKKAFYAKLTIAWSLFLVFWTVGSAIFMATEGWSYGISIYFCFVAFSTIGYGDYYPQTPAGRSIFVVWAIMGVGTMTILISVVQEAYNSKYKNALHIGAFDKAVKRYREKAQISRSTRGAKINLRERARSNADTIVPERDLDPNAESPAESSTQKFDLEMSTRETRAQDKLEALPGAILRQAKTFHKYIRAFVDGGVIPGGEIGRLSEVSDGLRGLLDEIAGGGGIGKVSKEEIMQDAEARQILFMLSIEKALHKMIDAAEEAMDAIRARDLGFTAQQQPRHSSTPEELKEEPMEDASTNGEESMHTAEADTSQD